MSENTLDMDRLTQRAADMVLAIANATMRSHEIAAEMVDRAGDVAAEKMRGRMDADLERIDQTAKTEVEKIRLEGEVQRVQVRMMSFMSVLESIGAAKVPLLERHATAEGPQKATLTKFLEMLTAQEVAVMQKAGLAPEVAQQAIGFVDGTPVYVRKGKKFVKQAGGA